MIFKHKHAMQLILLYVYNKGLDSIHQSFPRLHLWELQLIKFDWMMHKLVPVHELKNLYQNKPSPPC